MKFSFFLDKNREEEVIVYAHEKTKLIDSLEQLCIANGLELMGYKDKESFRLELSEVFCFVVEENKIFALTEKDKFQLKCRLYQLEEQLSHGFVKINQSCIANIQHIQQFDASISGALTVKFKNGYKDYVSRRNLKTVKERIGL